MLSKVMLGVILSLLILLTVGGNVLVCLAVCASRRLRCLTNCFIVSLAVTDLLLGLLVLPFSALLQLSDEWPFGPVFCNFYISMDVMLCTASILTLLAISVDRYLAVTMPLRYASLVLPWRVTVALVSVWTVSVAVSFLPIQMGWNTVNGTVQNHGPWASERRCRFELNRPYVLTDSLLTFYLPLLAMCWTYLQILRIARAQAKRIISARPICITSYNCRNSPSTSTTLVSGVTAVALRDHKATLTLAAVIGAFVVCWLPYFILFTVLGLKEHPDPGIVPEFPIVLWLGYANSALNPLIYGALNKDFRSAYAHLLKCGFPTYNGWRSQQSSPTFTAARKQLTEVTLLCGHTSASCTEAITSQNVMLQDVSSRGAAATTQSTNGTATTDVSGNQGAVLSPLYTPDPASVSLRKKRNRQTKMDRDATTPHIFSATEEPTIMPHDSTSLILRKDKRTQDLNNSRPHQ